MSLLLHIVKIITLIVMPLAGCVALGVYIGTPVALFIALLAFVWLRYIEQTFFWLKENNSDPPNKPRKKSARPKRKGAIFYE